MLTQLLTKCKPSNVAHSKTKFNEDWLRDKDVNWHLIEFLCHAHASQKYKVVGKLCVKDIQVGNGAYLALLQHSRKEFRGRKLKLDLLWLRK